LQVHPHPALLHLSIKGRLAKMPQRKTTQQITKLLTLSISE